jgi:hypothetical protein
MKLVLLSVATATAMAVPASAQDAAPAAAQEAVAVPEAAIATVDSAVATPAPVSVAAPACELHVFPTLEGQAMTTTMLSSFGIVGAIADAAQNKDRNISEAEYLKEALGPRLQIEALKSVNLPASLKIPASQIIYETPIADRKISTKATGRLSSSTAPCYAELLITQNFYIKRAIYGRSLNNRFIFKDFRGGKAKAKLVKGRGGNGLSFFPPKTTDETEVAEKELREVFAKNFTEFANGVK